MLPVVNIADKRRSGEYVGCTLGNYRILRTLGAGGMGTVFLAHDLTLEREVALKVISPELARNPVLMNRFKVEAIAQAKLNHKNIVTIHTFCKDEVFIDKSGTYYFVMEYVDGITLKTLIADNGAMPVNQALNVFSQILDGMGYAHSRGVIHRDIKPANIFLNSHHTAKIGDFGIAKVGGIDGLTRVGCGMGSPMYSAPEQLMGQSADERSDIYSLGMTLYEMLAGTPPLRIGGGDGVDSLTEAAESMPVRSTAINPAIPADVDSVIMKSITKDPAERFQTIKEFKSAIDGLLLPVTPVPETRTDSGRAVVVDPDELPWTRSVKKVTRQFRFPTPVLALPPKRTLRRIAAVMSLVLIVLVGYLVVSGTRNGHGPAMVVGSQDTHTGVPQPRRESPPVSSGTIQPTPTAPATFPATSPSAAPNSLSTAGVSDVSDVLAKMQWLIAQKEYKRAISMGKSVADAGELSGDLLQMIALAYFCDGGETQSNLYIDRTLDQAGSIRYRLQFETPQKRYVKGTLSISRRELSFRSGPTATPLLALSLTGIKDVSDDLRSNIRDLFKRKQNRRMPILIIKSQRNAQYHLQLERDDDNLRKFIKHVINTLRRS